MRVFRCSGSVNPGLVSQSGHRGAMCLDWGSGKGKSGVLTDEELGAVDEHGD